MYIKIMQSKYGVEARQTILQNSYYMMEKLNTEIKDFQIDYEEYHNRKLVGCDDNTHIDTDFVRNVESWAKNGHCDEFTAYGNQNSVNGWNTGDNRIYFCSSKTGYQNPHELVIQSPNVQNGSWCFLSWYFTKPYRQSFGQYQEHFMDVNDNVDFFSSAVGDNDDENIWKWPQAIADPNNIQEIYLISTDKTKRLLLRRALVATGDWDGDWLTTWESEQRYTIQILRLKGFDAWNQHDFHSTGVYDGNVDTRACDYSQWFLCNGTGIDNLLYSWYRLPKNADDGWVNLFEKNLTLAQRNILIYPDRYGDYARSQEEAQLNPYIQLNIQNKLYGEVRERRLKSSIKDFQITLQTTFNTKGVYTR